MKRFYMKLKISNFAKIKEAEIIVDGITVIAGENNTGKSTIGKILFCLFNSISNIDEKIANQRIKEIERTCRTILQNSPLNIINRNSSVRNMNNLAHRIASQFKYHIIKKVKLSSSKIHDTISSILSKIDISMPDDLVDSMTERITSIVDLSEEYITIELLNRYFNNVFHNQMNSFFENDCNAELQLVIKEKKVDITISDNSCIDFSSEIAIMHNAIYIDNPFIIDSLSSFNYFNSMDGFLKDLLTYASEDNIIDGIIESVLVKEKLNEIYQTIQSVVHGKVIQKQDEYYLEGEDFSQPIYLSNLSTGLKSFIIIKMLLEKGCIKEKDVLVLDEPEIHLHPQWQVVYAELIVLLQKHFDLSIIVATHSPYFLDAINLYSIKHGVDKKVNYYLSSIENNRVKMNLVTDSIDLIYNKMASPIQILDSLRYDLNNN